LASLLASQWPDMTGSAIASNALNEGEFIALRAGYESVGVALKDRWLGKQLLIVEE
jgi:hypothetical protein